MKRVIIILASAILLASCSSQAKLLNTSTHSRSQAVTPVAAILADLQVNPEKINYLYIPSNTVKLGGEENVINSAVSEALMANGNADVLVSMEHQIKYNADGQIESVLVTGYVAKYVNFRNPSEGELYKYLQNNNNGGSDGDSKKIKLF